MVPRGVHSVLLIIKHIVNHIILSIENFHLCFMMYLTY